jgi:transposase InsO family protein
MTLNSTNIKAIDFSEWPSVSLDGLSPEKRKRFQAYQLAIEMFSKGKRLVTIEIETGINRSHIYYLLKRANSIHPDGRLFGFRALFPYARVKSYKRVASIKRKPRQIKAGESGAMVQLFVAYPELEKYLKEEIAHRPLLFTYASNGHLALRGLVDIHRNFINQCRKLGLGETDYPLNKDQKGIRSLSNYIKKIATKSFKKTAKASGAAFDKGLPTDRNPMDLLSITRPYQAVEFDGHRLDIRLSVSFPDPFGFHQTLEVNRIWILVVIDIFTRATLGYHLALSTEYSRHDVIRAIQNSVEPHKPIKFTIPGLDYGQYGGFPSQKLPELAFAVWDEFRFDNAKAHLAEDTLQRLCEELGCIAHAGPPADPDKRPIIERFFKTLATTMSHRLPASTLSNPTELRRLLNSTNQQLALPIPLNELEELVEAVLASLNAAPHTSLGGRSPLQALEYWVRGQSAPIRHLPENLCKNLCLLQAAHRSRVNGNIARGIRPYISFYGVRYTNRSLSERTDLIGKQLLIYYHPDDIRSLRAFEQTGGEMGMLTAVRPWDKVTHSLRTRRQILKLVRDKKLEFGLDSDPVNAYIHYLRQQAPKRRKAANELELIRRSIQDADWPEKLLLGPTRQDTPPMKTDTNADSFDTETEEQGPAMPKRLSIPSGFNR